MLINWLRNNVYAAIALTAVRLVLGWKWLEAGWHKSAGETPFDASGFLKNAVNNPVVDKGTNELVYPTFTAFLEHVALPNVKLINFMIPWGEFLVGLGLLLGCLTTAAAFFGLLMNFMFMFAGTVSTNPWLILLGFVVFTGGANAAKFGLDHYVLPLIHKWTNRWLNRKGKHDPAGKPGVPGMMRG